MTNNRLVSTMNASFQEKDRVSLMEFRIILEPDLQDGGYVAHCPALLGCYSQGDSREEAISNVREAIEAYIGSLRKDGLPIPGDVEPEIVRLSVHA